MSDERTNLGCLYMFLFAVIGWIIGCTLGRFWPTDYSTTIGRAEATCYGAGLGFIDVSNDGRTAVCGSVQDASERRAIPVPTAPPVHPLPLRQLPISEPK